MKFIILQDLPYSLPEGPLAQYHGIIWAEELVRRGHEATKMVIGNPDIIKPVCPLLSVSTSKQRTNPAFWRNQRPDFVLYYAPFNKIGIQTLGAIREGWPSAFIVARHQGVFGFPQKTPRVIVDVLRYHFVQRRHCPTEGYEKQQSPRTFAAIYALVKTVLGFFSFDKRLLVQMAELSDKVTFQTENCVADAKRLLRSSPDLADKIDVMGYPIRKSFGVDPKGKTSKSVISIANWRHFKDPELTADAMALVLSRDPEVTYTIVGRDSNRVADRLLTQCPNAKNNVRVFAQIPNSELPELLSTQQVFLACSWREGYCVALSEALASGCSLVCTSGAALRGFREHVEKGTGIQAKRRTPEAVARCVLNELSEWEKGTRMAGEISERRIRMERVDYLCDRLVSFANSKSGHVRAVS